MNKICGIYKITSPSNKIYIGQSRDANKRFNLYRLLHCKRQFYLYNSFLKYGFENHKIEIIHQCDEHELNNLGNYYVNFGKKRTEKYLKQ